MKRINHLCENWPIISQCPPNIEVTNSFITAVCNIRSIRGPFRGRWDTSEKNLKRLKQELNIVIKMRTMISRAHSVPHAWLPLLHMGFHLTRKRALGSKENSPFIHSSAFPETLLCTRPWTAYWEYAVKKTNKLSLSGVYILMVW